MDGTDGSLPVETLVETVEGGLFVLDDDGRIVWTDATFPDLVGGPDADPTGRAFASVFGDALDATDIDAVADGDGGPLTIRPAPGSDAVYEVDVRPVPGGGYAGCLRDVSARRRHEREIERYRTVLDTVEDAVYMTDEDRRFTWVNAAAERMFGYDRETFVGAHLFDFLTDEQVEVAERIIESLLADDRPDVVTFEMEPTRNDGTTFPAETRTTLLPGDGFTGTVGVVRDVSERKERERELRRQNERLDEFASLVSHDLRNPLNVAQGRLKLAREDCDSAHLDALRDAHERMEQLIEDLLTLARSGEALTETTAVDLAAAVERSWKSVETAGATLRTETTGTIRADESRLRQLLENLVRNAVEHGGDGVTVTVGDLADGTGFYVEDDGPGIPPDRRDRAFEAGYSTARDGIGYGLSIVREIADAHDWEIRVTEGTDGGARFEITGVTCVDE